MNSRAVVMTWRALGLGLSLCATSIGLFATRHAHACSTPEPPPALVGYPEDGSVGVPTDVLPIYNPARFVNALSALPDDNSGGNAQRLASVFELVDDEGSVTPLEIGGGGGVSFVELVPPADLAPRTRYTLRTTKEHSMDNGLQLSFTTADGPLATPPEPPSANLEHYSLISDEPTSCSPWPAATCISISDSKPGVYVEEVELDAEGNIRSPYVYLFNGSMFTDIAGIDQGTSFDCVELRTRAPNGVFSDSVTLCRQDGELFDLRGSEDIACTPQGITQDGNLMNALPPAADAAEPTGSSASSADADESLSEQPASCSLHAGSSTSRNALLLGAVSLLLALRRRLRVGFASTRGKSGAATMTLP